MQRLLAIAWLTWKAALRFRLFLVLAALLLAAVVGLPLLIKDDGTARGFTQILLTYTLSVITGLLGLSTLWLSCGTLARDIEENQIQVVATKPVARWQIWLGKWLGIVSLNAVLLAIAGLSVYLLLQWRATKLAPEEQAILRNEVLVARGSSRPPDVSKKIAEETDRVLRERLKDSPPLNQAEMAEIRMQLYEQLKAEYQIVPPGYTRSWEIELGLARKFLKDKPLQLRVKFNSAEKSPTGTFLGMWRAGIPQKTELWGTPEPLSLAPDTFHEIAIAPNTFDENGILRIEFWNQNNTTLLFPLEEGIEVLYREADFGLNFARGLGIIFCWMALLAAVGLFAAAFLSFPVAAFFALGMLIMAFSSGTLATVVEEGTIMSTNEETGETGFSALDYIIVPAFKGALVVINLARDFSPIEALSTGRSITWAQLGRAVLQIIILLGGIIALLGVTIFNRRELAAQGNQ
jgi:hypothetical protein